MQLTEIMGFAGKWRTYQKRVLDRSGVYLQDKRIHIVAAPGSGKTTLGIELIRRLNAPCLVLSPSINIRDQWLSRIRESFLPKGEPSGLLSNNIKEPGVITAITYQALHSGMTKAKGKGKATDAATQAELFDAQNEADAGNDTVSTNLQDEIIDYSDFDFFTTVRRNGIKTICLDEAHHLRSEWWKALEEMVEKLPECTIISLTATPPYDSTPAQWERYISLCGPIDEEIIVPELVKEGSLCPHQDYVYFNMPTEEEEQAVKKFTEEAVKKAEEIFRDEEFTRLITTHRGLAAPKECADIFLKNPQYLSALLIFLQAKNIAFSRELLQMLGGGSKLPAMTMKWMEVLLQGFLYDDRESYAHTDEYAEKMIGSLKARGLIQKKKVCLVANDTINKLLETSKGKLNSILEIVRAEYENLGEELRLLILTDYIKKEYMQAIGDTEKGVNELGIIPIFENIRRTFSGLRTEKNTTKTGERITASALRIGVLSGTVVIIPSTAVSPMEAILNREQVKANFKALDETGFYQVNIVGSELTASSILTELFNQGELRVLIGTKSLLGEGWDSPCINSLILASFVGSFMLSNQMRGRAIRVMKGNPNKVSNIWHLICMQPESATKVTSAAGRDGLQLKGEEESEDFTTLKRRFEGFLGVHYEKNSIENGLERLSYIKGPYTAPMLSKINEQMLSLASNRMGLKQKWDEALAPLNQIEVAVEAGVSKDFFRVGGRIIGNILKAALVTVIFLFCAGNGIRALFADRWFVLSVIVAALWGIPALIAGIFAAKEFIYISRVCKPENYMKTIGNCILSALKSFGTIKSRDAVVAVDVEGEDDMGFLYLRGGSEREKEEFAKCVCEFFGMADNQRYILVAVKASTPKYAKYYNVPELFGKKKEDAELFHKKVSRYIGKYTLHYTKSQEGKKLLLSVKVHDMANKNPNCVSKKKKVRNRV